MKKVTMKIADAIAMKNKMTDLVENTTRKFRGKYALIFIKNYNALKDAAKDFDELQSKLLNELNENDELILDENGRVLGIKDDEKAIKFNSEVLSMSQVEVEVPICTISEEELNTLMDQADFSVAETEVIYGFLPEKEVCDSAE